MKKNNNKIIMIMILCIVSAIIAVLCYWLNFRNNAISTDPTDWAVFGDYIGGVLGALFGLFSTLIVCFTFFEQAESQRIQQLDSSFFNLLLVQKSIIDGIKSKVQYAGGAESTQQSGIEYINDLAHAIIEREKKYTENDGSYEENLIGYYDESLSEKNLLGYYFRHMYHIIKYVDNSNVPENIKRKYIDIIQAQMNNNELYVCLLNSCSKNGRSKFKPLLEKYNFFENIQSESEKFKKYIKEQYPTTIFKFE